MLIQKTFFLYFEVVLVVDITPSFGDSNNCFDRPNEIVGNTMEII